VDSLALRIHYQRPELRDEPAPTGFVHLERGPARAVLLTPDEIEPDRLYPLVAVLHGAGRQDELLARACREEPERRQALFLIPRSVRPTWDLIAGGGRPDLDFLEYAYDLIYRRYPVDPLRQALLGYSDGASYALSVGLANPRLFSAVMGWAAGFCAFDPAGAAAPGPRPRILLEYGTHDPLFPFERVALPMRAELEARGYDVTFRVDEGGRHWPSSDFQPEALDWFFSLDPPSS
jgi:predicted esterase